MPRHRREDCLIVSKQLLGHCHHSLEPECDTHKFSLARQWSRILWDGLSSLVEKGNVSKLEECRLLCLCCCSFCIFTRSHSIEKSAFNKLATCGIHFGNIISFYVSEYWDWQWWLLSRRRILLRVALELTPYASVDFSEVVSDGILVSHWFERRRYWVELGTWAFFPA